MAKETTNFYFSRAPKATFFSGLG